MKQIFRWSVVAALVLLASVSLGWLRPALAAGGHITGTVGDAEGNPLAGIAVYATQYNASTGEWGFGLRVETSADGSYDLFIGRPGSYQLYFADEINYGYVSEFYDDASTIEEATNITVASARR